MERGKRSGYSPRLSGALAREELRRARADGRRSGK
jgi:hypothetical protein